MSGKAFRRLQVTFGHVEGKRPSFSRSGEVRFDHRFKHGLGMEPVAGGAEDQQTVRKRNGEVLKADRCLKCDHFPKLQAWEAVVAGAPNFFEVECPGDVRLFGCAQPTEKGIGNVLAHLEQAGLAGPKLWVSCRSEPVVYIKGRPYSVKHCSDFMRHLTWEADWNVADSLDRSLRDDVISEASANDWIILLHEEDDRESVYVVHADLSEFQAGVVKTPEEVFYDLKHRACFERWPVDDERPPTVSRVEQLAALVSGFARRSEGQRPCIVFNCHQGRHRTTTALVLASLVLGATARPEPNGGPAADLQAEESPRQILEQGKRRADASIDRCALPLGRKKERANLRKAVREKLERLGSAQKGGNDAKTRHAADQFRWADERFQLLVLFAAYLEQGLLSTGVPFSRWKEEVAFHVSVVK